MSTYTTNTSDKTKSEALKWWKKGIFGFFGLEYFYVGKMKSGIVRVIIAVFFALGFLAVLVKNGVASIPVFLVVWALLSLPNLYQLKMGTFKDNTGAILRE